MSVAFHALYVLHFFQADLQQSKCAVLSCSHSHLSACLVYDRRPIKLISDQHANNVSCCIAFVLRRGICFTRPVRRELVADCSSLPSAPSPRLHCRSAGLLISPRVGVPCQLIEDPALQIHTPCRLGSQMHNVRSTIIAILTVACREAYGVLQLNSLGLYGR
jgi:hypothetical protein